MTAQSEPALPLTSGDLYATGNDGLTACEHAAIELRVPDSGEPWLDAMITKANRMRLASDVFTELVWPYTEGEPKNAALVAEHSLTFADAILAELDKE